MNTQKQMVFYIPQQKYEEILELKKYLHEDKDCSISQLLGDIVLEKVYEAKRQKTLIEGKQEPTKKPDGQPDTRKNLVLTAKRQGEDSDLDAILDREIEKAWPSKKRRMVNGVELDIEYKNVESLPIFPNRNINSSGPKNRTVDIRSLVKQAVDEAMKEQKNR